MGLNLNEVLVAGNLTGDPVHKQLPTGMDACEYCIAINERRTNRDGTESNEVVFLNLCSYGKAAVNDLKYLKKGACVLVNAKIKMDVWTDKVTGDKKTKLKFIAIKTHYISSKADMERYADEPTPQSPSARPNPEPSAHRYSRAYTPQQNTTDDDDVAPF